MYHEDQQRFSKDSPLSVIDSSGRQVSLLNDSAAAAAAAAAATAGLPQQQSQQPPRPIPTSHTSMEYEDSGLDQQRISTVSPYSPSSSCSTSSIEDMANRDQACSSSSDITMVESAAWQSQSPQQLLTQQQQHPHQQQSLQQQQQQQPQKGSNRRKYHCTEPGCNKSFTTSGHLARHNRIHTGEKNFPCLFPGCQSRFSRQDNMMQHYRTHMSPKSRRTQNRTSSMPDEARPRPRLHAHHRIRSDPFRVEPPLTIDQHLNNYHRSLLAPSARTERFSPTRYSQVDAGKQQQQQQQQRPQQPQGQEQPQEHHQPQQQRRQEQQSLLLSVHQHKQRTSEQQPTRQASPAGSPSVNAVATGITHTDAGSTGLIAITNMSAPSTITVANTTAPTVATSTTTPTSAILTSIVPSVSTPTSSVPISSSSASIPVFYQHRPLTNLPLMEQSARQTPPFAFTLLHPAIRQDVLEGTRRTGGGDKQDDTSSDGLLQLAHVVSTFG